MFENLIAALKADKRKIVFTEGPDARILEAASRLKKDGILDSILVGNVDEVKAAAKAGRLRAWMADQHASAASARAFTFTGVMSLPSTTEQPGRRGSSGTIIRWASRKRRVISSLVLSIFFGQKLLS